MQELHRPMPMSMCRVHEQSVLAHNNASDAHAHYNFFRSLLAHRYESDLDRYLERSISFLEEVAGSTSRWLEPHARAAGVAAARRDEGVRGAV